MFMRFFSVKAIDGSLAYINVEKISMVWSMKGTSQAKLAEQMAPVVEGFIPERVRRDMGVTVRPESDITEIFVSGNVVRTYVPVEEILKKLKEL